MKTELKLYDLWYDGVAQVKSADVEKFISMVPSGKLAVDELTANIKQYNSLVSKSEAITIKEGCNPLNFDWNIPDKYKELDLKSYLMDKLLDMEVYDDHGLKKRISRTLTELSVFEKAGLIPLLQCLVYVVDVFTQDEIVWGVGRGSSVSSYILYLIGIHDIDCMQFDLPFSDFMKT